MKLPPNRTRQDPFCRMGVMPRIDAHGFTAVQGRSHLSRFVSKVLWVTPFRVLPILSASLFLSLKLSTAVLLRSA